MVTLYKFVKDWNNSLEVSPFEFDGWWRHILMLAQIGEPESGLNLREGDKQLRTLQNLNLKRLCLGNRGSNRSGILDCMNLLHIFTLCKQFISGNLLLRHEFTDSGFYFSNCLEEYKLFSEFVFVSYGIPPTHLRLSASNCLCYLFESNWISCRSCYNIFQHVCFTEHHLMCDNKLPCYIVWNIN